MTGGSFNVARENTKPGNSTEFMSESYSRRSWKGLACAVLVIAAVAAIIAVIVVYASPDKYKNVPGTLNLEDVVKGKYSAKSFNGSWVSDTQFAYLDQDEIKFYDVTKQTWSVLVSNETLADLDYEDYFISTDHKYVLISYNASKVFRHSTLAYYLTYDVVAKKLTPLGSELLQYAAFGPKGSQLVYVKDNNVWYKESVSATDAPIQITTDGKNETIYNGIPDWVYEEEVLSTNYAIWWSPNGNKFSFMRFDDTNVPTMNYMKYGSFKDVNNDYPDVVSIKYPKPGRTNPTVKLFIVDLTQTTKTPKEVKLSDKEITGDFYITGVTWATNDTLSAVWVPRIQNRAIVTLCSTTNFECVKKSEEKQSSGWVDGAVPKFTDDGKTYFLIQAKDNNYRHLVKFSAHDGSKEFLTNGTYEVTEILHYDSVNKSIYYQRTVANDPSSRHIAKVNIDKPLVETCLTCHSERKCSFFDADISKHGSYAVIKCNGGENTDVLPWVQIRALPNMDLVSDFELNDALKEKLANQTLCDYVRKSVPIDGGYEALVRLYIPKDLNQKSKYPLLVSVYGGPGSQAITNSFSVSYAVYMASVNKIIYAEIDGRGSSLRGNKLMFEVYKRLGTVEIEDQIEVAKYLGKTLPYIDSNRMAIWGWSYGGYAAGMALATGNETFKCGISVAPVTSWYYYDSIYTERYMLTPDDNLDSYNTSRLTMKANLFNNKKYLLVHGTGDDNVHVQQSMLLIKALNKAGILYNTHLYPDEAHSIDQSKVHVYRTITQFVQECLR